MPAAIAKRASLGCGLGRWLNRGLRRLCALRISGRFLVLHLVAMVIDRASGCGAQHRMVARNVSSDATNRCATDAALCVYGSTSGRQYQSCKNCGDSVFHDVSKKGWARVDAQNIVAVIAFLSISNALIMMLIRSANAPRQKAARRASLLDLGSSRNQRNISQRE
ncbi:MAG: hypothetical protein ACR2GP_09390 [Burkholderiaceae bacterium]